MRDRNYELAMPYLNDCIAYTTESGFDAARLYMMAGRARAHFEQGDWDTAAEEAGYVLSQYQYHPSQRSRRSQCWATCEFAVETLTPSVY